MDINKLLHFRTVVETQNIRMAAELLHMTPGALSKSMRVFQEELDINLIEPQGRGIIITEDGTSLYEKSHRLVEELDHLNRNLITPTETKIKFGTYEVFSTHFLSEFLITENIEQLNCLELGPGEIESSLLSREIDFGLNLVPFPHENLEHIKIGKTKLKTFCAKGSKFFDFPFSDLEYAIPTTQLSSNPSQSTAIDSWPDNIQRKIKYRFNMLETALQVTSKDSAVIYCPEISVVNYNKHVKTKDQLIEHPYKKPNKTMNIYLVKRVETSENDLTKKLAKFVRTN